MRHREGSEEAKIVLGRDNKISIGTAGLVISAVATAIVWGTVQVSEIKLAIRNAVSIEEFQAWSDEFRDRNPGVSVPSPRGVRIRRAESNLMDGKPLVSIPPHDQ